MAVINRIAEYFDEMKVWRRHIHAHPELDMECHRTAAFVVERLREFGVDEIHEKIGVSGVVGIINGCGEGPTIGLRADMDALPMPEETGLEYASTVEGVMHACGHDGHTTMLLGAAKYLASTRNFSGRVALIFQPGEEGSGGGRYMVEDGLFEKFGISQVFGQHSLPNSPVGNIETCPGPLLASADDFEIHIRPAKVAEIRAFSIIDEDNLKEVDEGLNNIVLSCTKIMYGNQRGSYKDILEEDRIYLILAIRDLTFPEPESKLTVQHKDKKGKKHEVEVKKENFKYFSVPDTLDKYYDKEACAFLIETKSFGTITMKPPTIGIMQRMTSYIKDRQEKGESIDQSVLQVMPYLVSEWRGFDDKSIFKFEIEMNGWSNKKYSLIYKLAEQMKIGIQPDMEVQIGDEWEVVPIGFRDGIKSLFIVQDIAGELL